MVSWDDQYGNPSFRKTQQGFDQFVKHVSLDMVLIEKVPAVDIEVGLDFQRMLDCSQETAEDGFGSSLTPLWIRLGCLCYFKSKMGVRRMNKSQRNPLF